MPSNRNGHNSPNGPSTPNNRTPDRTTRRGGALTRLSVRRSGRTPPGRTPPGQASSEPGGGSRLRYLKSPATWLAGILLAVATVTFQDTLSGAVKAILPLDRLPDRLSPQNAIDVVEVSDVKGTGLYLVRGDVDGALLDAFGSGERTRRRDADFVDVGQAEWMVTLQGRAAQQVRITDIVPEVEGGTCAAPLAGNLVSSPGQGVSGVISLTLAIDEPAPTLKVPKDQERFTGKKPEAGPDEPFFTGPEAHHITLEKNESEAFVIEATAERGYCRWRYRVHYQVGGSPAEMVLSRPGGKPFELTGRLAGANRYRSVYHSGVCTGTGKWLKITGEEYARALRRDKDALCPGAEGPTG
ncbi:hypothetical protein ACFY7Z_28130 [Streptomyces sp. NPDC012623]|uniref:hypothetical protein n=1 Tax=unclassified Streptomyces TaxID=2593676 RepID=UPI0036C96311